MKGKTNSGFKYDIDERSVSSWEFVEACTQMMSENEQEQLKGAVAYVNALLGKQKSLLVAHINKAEGLCTMESMLRETSEIVQQIKALKN